MSESFYEKVLEADLKRCGIGGFTREYRFDENGRKFRFDFAWLKEKVAVEVDGGVWTGGRHTRGKGYISDIDKLNCAVCQGWKVLRFTPDHVKRGDVIPMLRQVLAGGQRV